MSRSHRSRIMEVKDSGGYYERDSPRVPFNTPETLSSSSSSDESSPDLPRRREKVMMMMMMMMMMMTMMMMKVLATLQRENILHQDEDYDHLDFSRRDQLDTFCRARLNRVTGRTLYIVLMEMRRMDVSRDRVLDPVVINQIMETFGIPLSPCMPQLHALFRNGSYISVRSS